MKKSIGLISCLIFGLVTAGAFYWIWMQANAPIADSAGAKVYTAVEVEAVKNQANDILASLQKNSDIPLGTPTTKMGRTNPFAGF